MKDGDSMLAKLVGGKWPSEQDNTGAILVDRSPQYFAPLLGFLRSGELHYEGSISLAGLLEEARFFGLATVVQALEAEVAEVERLSTKDRPFTRNEFVRILASTASSMELRCQGFNFEGADLSRLDLRRVNFRSCNLKNCNFQNARLDYATFDNANCTVSFHAPCICLMLK